MAELNRELQEYLSRSKSGSKSGSLSGRSGSAVVDLGDPGEEPEEPAGSWFRRFSPFPQSPAAEPEPCSSCFPELSRRQRLVGCGVCAAFSALCFGLSALYAPLLLLYARKFALLWSLGSLFAVAAVALLRGPGKLLYELPTSPVSVTYLCALCGTLYAALSLQSTVLTALGAAAQVAVILGAAVTLLPGGAAGLRFMSGLAASAIKRTVTGKSMAI